MKAVTFDQAMAESDNLTPEMALYWLIHCQAAGIMTPHLEQFLKKGNSVIEGTETNSSEQKKLTEATSDNSNHSEFKKLNTQNIQ